MICMIPGCTSELPGTHVALEAATTRAARRCVMNRRMAMNLRTTALAVISVLALSGAAPSRAHAQQVGKYKNNGEYAYAYGNDTTGCRYFYISVAKGGTNAAPQTNLLYEIYDSCTGAWVSSGWGMISNSAFKRSGKTMTLNFTASSSGSFYLEGEAVAFALMFTKDSVFTSTWSGHSRWQYYTHVVQFHGSGTQNSATLSGTIGGSAPQASWATMGTGRDRYIEFDRGKN
jgi:hypothetical protein